MEIQKPKLTILSEEAIGKIIDEAMEALEKLGITIEDPDTLGILGDMGAEITKETHNAKIKRSMVEAAIKSTPKELTLYDMAGNEKFSFGDGQIHFDPGSAALFLYDAANSVMKLPKVDDVARYAKLTHTLEHIEATSTALIPSEVPKELSDIIRVYISCLFTDKPVVTGTFSEKGFAVMRDLLLSRSGRESMRGAPCTVFDVCPTSPLRWSELGCHDLRECAQNAFPVQFISMPLPGALAPMSLLASVVQHTIETLSGIVITQAYSPGSPIIYGGSPALFDMRYSTSPMGAVETLMIDIGYAEVGKSMGFPTQAYLGMSDSKTLDAQAGMETAMTLVAASAGAIDFVSGPGMLNFESCQCFEKLVLDNDICGMVRRFKQGMEPRGKTLGVDAIAEGLADSNYLTTDMTLELYKKEAHYPSNLIDRKAYKDEGKVNDRRLVEEAAAQVEKRLSEYTQPAIPDTNLRDMESIMAGALEPYGLADLAKKIK
jgi:trimethylamine--corrinoid protein Co-methyltransferase